MACNGKAKGSAFERQVCKELSLWITAGKREDCLWRSAMSGGRATVGRRAGKQHDHHAGDISATSPEGHQLTDRWYIECKFYKDLAIKAALLEGKGTLAQFWRETCEQASHYNKMPMLIAKQNNTRTLLLTPLGSHMMPTGISPLRKAKIIAKMFMIRADMFCYKSVLEFKFSDYVAPYDPFLAPGELQRILYGTGSRKVQRLKIKRDE